MDVLILYMSIVVAGYFVGAFLKKKNIVLRYAGVIQTIALVSLVFLMGSRIGSEEEIVTSLDTIGLKALAITLMILAGTVITAFVVRKLLGFDRRGMLLQKVQRSGVPGVSDQGEEMEPLPDAAAEEFSSGKADSSSDAGAASGTVAPADVLETVPSDSEPEEKSDKTMLLCIFVPVAVGILSGYFFLPDGFIAMTGTLIVVGLCILLLFVGLDLGMEGTIVENFRRAGWRVIVFPFVMITGTYLGAAASSLFLSLSVKDALCIASGFGWYTLAPAMLAEYSIEVSAISFMHNVMRELLGILLLPLVAGRIGHIEATGLVGAGSMDVCLPIIVRTTSGNMAVYAFVIGVVLSIAVPVMVSFMMGL